SLALPLLALHPGLPGVLTREDPPRPAKRLLQGAHVVEVTRHDLGPRGREGLRRLPLRLARERPDLVSARQQLPRDRPALLPRGSRHQDDVSALFHERALAVSLPESHYAEPPAKRQEAAKQVRHAGV